jgi:hypothetical protein
MPQISAVAFARLLVRLTEGVAAAATHEQHRQRIRTVRAQQHATYDMPHRHWMPMVRPSLSLELVLEEETLAVGMDLMCGFDMDVAILVASKSLH